MHETFVFNMDCKGVLHRWDSVEFSGANNNRSFHGRTNNILEHYDPFDFDNLIPEFVDLIKKMRNGRSLEKSIEEWVLKWGPLTEEYSQQTTNAFWEEANRFYKIWEFYKLVANRDKGLLSIVQMDKEREDYYKLTFFPNDESFQQEKHPSEILNDQIGKDLFWTPEYDMKTTFPMKINPERSKFDHILEHSMYFLFTQIEEYTSRAYLAWGSMQHIKKENKSNFKIRPVLQIDNLIDAIYLQFYILFSENEKKICPICNTPFVPPRKDKKYCSDSCYLTAKSRRYRAKKSVI